MVYVTNANLARQFEEQREKFRREGKVREDGRVEESLLYHGSSVENINKIVAGGFCLDSEPEDSCSNQNNISFNIIFSYDFVRFHCELVNS